jgi:hypothetical protein
LQVIFWEVYEAQREAKPAGEVRVSARFTKRLTRNCTTLRATVFAAKHGFTFPYVIDETQEVARAYGAQCTPDFFGFNGQDELQYRGRLDASRMTLVPNARRDLFEAMKQVAETGHGPANQTPSMGCSIKWKD